MTTFKLTKSNHGSLFDIPFNIGNIIKDKDSKRWEYKVMDIIAVQYGHKVSVLPVYKPSPRSRLNRRGVFSKMKVIII